MSEPPQRPSTRASRRVPGLVPASPAVPSIDTEDRFFRHIVSSMRNGVIAVRRDGTLMLMNAEAYRIFSLTPDPADIGRPFADVLKTRGDIVRVLTTAFELSLLPNRAETRLRDLDRVIGYTLSQVKDDSGDRIGAVMFFKDLTQVEQMEERERLRDRLASLGEMAAGIAHELKNPLAGIEVMAGLLRRQVPDSVDAQSLLADIISEAKLANAIVVEMLEFVRPVRLQVEHTNITDVVHQAVTLAESKVARGAVDRGAGRAAGSAGDRVRPLPALPGLHESHRERIRGARRQGNDHDHGVARRHRIGPGLHQRAAGTDADRDCGRRG